MSLIDKILDKCLKKRVIVNCDRGPYLHRWFLVRRASLGMFIHKFVRSDEDRALHYHPWDFIVIPIWRGYIEHNTKGKVRVLPFLGTRFRRGEYRHRVELLQDCEVVHNSIAQLDSEKEYQLYDLPSWSIFIRFRKRRLWGFWPDGIFQAWNKWWNDKCGGEEPDDPDYPSKYQ